MSELFSARSPIGPTPKLYKLGMYVLDVKFQFFGTLIARHFKLPFNKNKKVSFYLFFNFSFLIRFSFPFFIQFTYLLLCTYIARSHIKLSTTYVQLRHVLCISLGRLVRTYLVQDGNKKVIFSPGGGHGTI
jgi:hypothetical protein